MSGWNVWNTPAARPGAPRRKKGEGWLKSIVIFVAPLVVVAFIGFVLFGGSGSDPIDSVAASGATQQRPPPLSQRDGDDELGATIGKLRKDSAEGLKRAGEAPLVLPTTPAPESPGSGDGDEKTSLQDLKEKMEALRKRRDEDGADKQERSDNDGSAPKKEARGEVEAAPADGLLDKERVKQVDTETAVDKPASQDGKVPEEVTKATDAPVVVTEAPDTSSSTPEPQQLGISRGAMHLKGGTSGVPATLHTVDNAVCMCLDAERHWDDLPQIHKRSAELLESARINAQYKTQREREAHLRLEGLVKTVAEATDNVAPTTPARTTQKEIVQQRQWTSVAEKVKKTGKQQLFVPVMHIALPDGQTKIPLGGDAKQKMLTKLQQKWWNIATDEEGAPTTTATTASSSQNANLPSYTMEALTKLYHLADDDGSGKDAWASRHDRVVVLPPNTPAVIEVAYTVRSCRESFTSSRANGFFEACFRLVGVQHRSGQQAAGENAPKNVAAPADVVTHADTPDLVNIDSKDYNITKMLELHSLGTVPPCSMLAPEGLEAKTIDALAKEAKRKEEEEAAKQKIVAEQLAAGKVISSETAKRATELLQLSKKQLQAAQDPEQLISGPTSEQNTNNNNIVYSVPVMKYAIEYSCRCPAPAASTNADEPVATSPNTALYPSPFNVGELSAYVDSTINSKSPAFENKMAFISRHRLVPFLLNVSTPEAMQHLYKLNGSSVGAVVKLTNAEEMYKADDESVMKRVEELHAAQNDERAKILKELDDFVVQKKQQQQSDVSSLTRDPLLNDNVTKQLMSKFRSAQATAGLCDPNHNLAKLPTCVDVRYPLISEMRVHNIISKALLSCYDKGDLVCQVLSRSGGWESELTQILYNALLTMREEVKAARRLLTRLARYDPEAEKQRKEKEAAASATTSENTTTPQPPPPISKILNEYDPSYQHKNQNWPGNWRDDGVEFIDIGANVGAFTFYMWKMGFPVRSFDALPFNIQLLKQSECLNRKQQQIEWEKNNLREALNVSTPYFADLQISHAALAAQDKPDELCGMYSEPKNFGDIFITCNQSEVSESVIRGSYLRRGVVAMRSLDAIILPTKDAANAAGEPSPLPLGVDKPFSHGSPLVDHVEPTLTSDELVARLKKNGGVDEATGRVSQILFDEFMVSYRASTAPPSAGPPNPTPKVETSETDEPLDLIQVHVYADELSEKAKEAFAPVMAKEKKAVTPKQVVVHPARTTTSVATELPTAAPTNIPATTAVVTESPTAAPTTEQQVEKQQPPTQQEVLATEVPRTEAVAEAAPTQAPQVIAEESPVTAATTEQPSSVASGPTVVVATQEPTVATPAEVPATDAPVAAPMEEKHEDVVTPAPVVENQPVENVPNPDGGSSTGRKLQELNAEVADPNTDRTTRNAEQMKKARSAIRSNGGNAVAASNHDVSLNDELVLQEGHGDGTSSSTTNGTSVVEGKPKTVSKSKGGAAGGNTKEEVALDAMTKGLKERSAGGNMAKSATVSQEDRKAIEGGIKNAQQKTDYRFDQTIARNQKHQLVSGRIINTGEKRDRLVVMMFRKKKPQVPPTIQELQRLLKFKQYITKIDVEGHEIEVWKGATRFLEKDAKTHERPKLILSEVWRKLNLTEYAEVMIEKHGYVCFSMNRLTWLLDVPAVTRYWHHMPESMPMDTLIFVDPEYRDLLTYVTSTQASAELIEAAKEVIDFEADRKLAQKQEKLENQKQ